MPNENFNHKKKFGQNFLFNEDIPKKIVSNSNLTADHTVIEIGPGKGILTKQIASVAKQVFAFEIDTDLCDILNDVCNEFSNIKVFYNDIMKVDLSAFVQEYCPNEKIAVIANLPYYITTPIIMMLLEAPIKIDFITIMVQKEVASRITALPNTSDYGALTASINFYSKPKKLFNVPAGCFIPKPKVDSAVVKLDLYNEPPVNTLDDKLFFDVIKAAFQQRRKTLLNSLYSYFNGKYSKEIIKEIISNAQLKETVRGEELSIDQFCIIANLLFRHNNK